MTRRAATAINAAAPSSARIRVRRLPCPAADPPFDDEIGRRPGHPSTPPTTQGTLALAFTLPSGVPVEPTAPPNLRIVGAESTASGTATPLFGAETSFLDRQPTSGHSLPEPRRWSARLAQAIMETLHGHRPVQQLLRWTDDAVYATIVNRLAARPRDRARTRPTVRSIRVCTPTDGVVEASVVVQSGPRCRALALRLEGLDGQWRCTAMELI